MLFIVSILLIGSCTCFLYRRGGCQHAVVQGFTQFCFLGTPVVVFYISEPPFLVRTHLMLCVPGVVLWCMYSERFSFYNRE